MIRVAPLLLAALAASGSDIGPKPLDYAGHPTPLHDLKGVEVEMEAEEVKLVLSAKALEVDAAFTMLNHGGDATFEEGFPVGPFKTMTDFSITMDGAPAPFRLVDRSAKDPRAEPAPEGSGERAADLWYVWNASFKAGARHTHRVRYRLSLEHQRFYRQSGYVLHTGAAWKNPIGRATVVLAFGEGAGMEHLRGVTPSGAARFEKDRVVWTFEKLEPTKEHDIRIRYATRSWREDIAEERREAALAWSARRSLASTLGALPSYQGRSTFTAEELKDYLDAHHALIAELRVEDGKPVMPATDPELIRGIDGVVRPFEGMVRARYYLLESKPAEIFGGLFDEALKTARAHPDSARAREVLGAYRDFLRLLASGEMHFDYRPMAANKKIAAERKIRAIDRDDPRDGKVVPMEKPADAARTSLEKRIAEADALLR